MKRAQLIAFFNHISDRQRLYDLADVFRFKAVNDGRKKSTRKGTIQSEPAADDQDSADADGETTADADGLVDAHQAIPQPQVPRPRPRPLKKRAAKTKQTDADNTTVCIEPCLAHLTDFQSQ
jgi:hypothetical protein